MIYFVLISTALSTRQSEGHRKGELCPVLQLHPLQLHFLERKSQSPTLETYNASMHQMLEENHTTWHMTGNYEDLYRHSAMQEHTTIRVPVSYIEQDKNIGRGASVQELSINPHQNVSVLTSQMVKFTHDSQRKSKIRRRDEEHEAYAMIHSSSSKSASNMSKSRSANDNTPLIVTCAVLAALGCFVIGFYCRPASPPERPPQVLAGEAQGTRWEGRRSSTASEARRLSGLGRRASGTATQINPPQPKEPPVVPTLPLATIGASTAGLPEKTAVPEKAAPPEKTAMPEKTAFPKKSTMPEKTPSPGADSGPESQHPPQTSSAEFEIASIKGVRKFRWMTPTEIESLGLNISKDPPPAGEYNWIGTGLQEPARFHAEAGGSTNFIPAPWTADAVRKILSDHDHDTSNWRGDAVNGLVKECIDGRACLVIDANGNLKRIMEIVLVVINHHTTGNVIVPDRSTESRKFKSSASEFRQAMKGNLEPVPSIRRMYKERVEDAAQRCVLEKLGLPDGAVHVEPGRVKTFEQEENSDFYPGLTTVVCRHMLRAKVISTDKEVLKSIAADPDAGQADQGFGTEYCGEINRWVWKSAEEVPGLRQHMNWIFHGIEQLSPRATMHSPRGGTGAAAGGGRLRTGAMKAQMFKSTHRRSVLTSRDADLEVLVPWSEREVKDLLDEHNSAPEAFGMTLGELSQMASKGHLVFARRSKDERLVAVVDLICLRVFNVLGTGILVQTASADEEPGLPEIEWRLDERSWDAARRLARSQLLVDDETLTISSDLQEVQQGPEDEDSAVLVRKWTLTAKLNTGMEGSLGPQTPQSSQR